MKKEVKFVVYVLNLAVTALTAEPACPVCSRYHYEETLLERVLRNELALEQTLKDIKETNTKVVDSLKELQNENNKVNTAIELMERKQISMEATLGDTIKTALANVSESLSHILTESGRSIKDMEDRVERFKGDLKTPKILFRAQLASSITVNTGQDVVFTRVEVNEGRCYDNGTGKFAASVAGLYIFALHYCTQGNKWIDAEIVHNNKTLQRFAHYGTEGKYLGSSLQAYVMMVMGDIVWMRTTSTSHFNQNDSHCTTTFSGVLIRA